MKKCIKFFLLVLIILLPLSSCNGFIDNNSSSEKKVYDISDKYFSYLGFEKANKVTYIENREVKTPIFIVLGNTKLELFYLSVDAKMYDSNNNLLDHIIDTKNIYIGENSNFDIILDVDQYVYERTTTIVVEFSGKSYFSPKEIAPVMYTVTFIYNNGEENQIISVERGKTITQPIKPQKDNYEFEYWCTDSSLKNKFDFSEGIYGNIALFAKYRSLLCTITFVNNNGSSNFSISVLEGNTVSKPNNPIKENYLFDCWCTDSSLINEYDFSKDVYNDLTLYAKYYVDYSKLTNNITSSIMKTNVAVETKSYNTILGIETSSVFSSGSGVIFYSDNNNYYLLTNNHVSVKEKGYDKVSYKIKDYKDNYYTGTLIYDDPKYDLSVMSFKKGKEELGTISLADANPKTNDEIVAIGQPKGQGNAISFGKVIGYSNVTLSEAETYQSNVQFPVIKHNAEIKNGSSGGAILDIDLNLVGINYAGSTKSDGTFIAGFSIPIEKVHEFLNLHFWN